MRFRRPLARSSFVALLLLPSCGGGSSGSDSADGGTNATPAPANARYDVAFGTTTFLAAPENGAMAALDGGDVIVSALTADGSLFAARLGPAAEVRWAKTYKGTTPEFLVSHVVVVGNRVVVTASSQSDDGVHLVDLDGSSGVVTKSRNVSGACMYPARSRILADGGLVVSCSSEAAHYLRLNASSDVTWSKSGRAGGDVHVLSDGFAFVGVSSSLTPVNPSAPTGPQVGTGAAVHLVSNDGVSKGWTFMGPGPGSHSVGGVRALPDGKLLVALGVDSTRADSPASLSPLVLATFGSDGSAGTMARADMTTKDANGRDVPLQFGGAKMVTAVGDETWIGFVANSGRLGSDVRGSVLARFAADGSAKDAVLGAIVAAPTTGGASLAFAWNDGRMTFHRAAPGAADCTTRPSLTLRSITPFLDKKAAADSALTDVPSTATDRPLTEAVVTGTTTPACGK
ncbi:MAG: hypothetical protein U0169_03680 [Polyangiaceae bacterium]